IESDSFVRALESGELDVCLDYLHGTEMPCVDDARLACRLGEKLFHLGRQSEAVECGRFAFDAAANDNDVAHFCAWLFSNSGCFREAIAAYERLIEDRPEWVD